MCIEAGEVEISTRKKRPLTRSPRFPSLPVPDLIFSVGGVFVVAAAQDLLIVKG